MTSKQNRAMTGGDVRRLADRVRAAIRHRIDLVPTGPAVDPWREGGALVETRAPRLREVTAVEAARVEAEKARQLALLATVIATQSPVTGPEPATGGPT